MATLFLSTKQGLRRWNTQYPFMSHRAVRDNIIVGINRKMGITRRTPASVLLGIWWSFMVSLPNWLEWDANLQWFLDKCGFDYLWILWILDQGRYLTLLEATSRLCQMVGERKMLVALVWLSALAAFRIGGQSLVHLNVSAVSCNPLPWPWLSPELMEIFKTLPWFILRCTWVKGACCYPCVIQKRFLFSLPVGMENGMKVRGMLFFIFLN